MVTRHSISVLAAGRHICRLCDKPSVFASALSASIVNDRGNALELTLIPVTDTGVVVGAL